MYSNGVYQSITVPGSTDTLAYGMNAAGQVVGSFIDQFGTHGFLYAQGSFTNFDAPNTLPTRGTFARDINDAGQILVTGSGNFLAIAAPASPVPEPRPFPSALVALGMGALVLKGKTSLQFRRECL